MHAHHETLPGYHKDQILHDGCPECEARSKSSDGGIAHLDRGNFVQAWARAATWNQSGLADLARAEMPMFNILWSMQLKLEQYGWPIGEVPRRASP